MDLIQSKQASNAAVKAAGNQKKTMQAYIKSMEGEIKKALPSVITPERFTRMVLSALSTNPKLQECTPQSFLGAMMTAAQLGVEPNTPLGQAYMLPYYNGKKQCFECQFQLGYKGLIDLANRSGEIKIIQAHEVYENDEFSYSFGLNPTLEHKPALSNRGNVIAYYAMYSTVNGGYGFEVMSVEDIKNHAERFSKSVGNGPWKTDFDAMAKKTVIKKVLKYAPLKSDFARQQTLDGTVKTEISEDMYDVPSEEIIVVDPDTGEVTAND